METAWKLVIGRAIYLFFVCVCSITDHKRYHDIDKVAVEPQGDRSADYLDVILKFIIKGQMHEKLTSICFFNKLPNCLLAPIAHNLPKHMNSWSVLSLTTTVSFLMH